MNLLSERLAWAMQRARDSGNGTVLPADVARAAKVSNATVNYWLNGVNGISAAKARLVADYLKVDALWLESGEGEPVHKVDQPAPSREARMILAYEDEEKLLDLYRRSDECGRKEIMGIAMYEGGGTQTRLRHNS